MSRLLAAKWIIPAWLLLVAVFLSITAYYIIFHPRRTAVTRSVAYVSHACSSKVCGAHRSRPYPAIGIFSHFLLYDIDLNFFNGNNHFLIAFDWLLNLSLDCAAVFADSCVYC
jgi:hypothetical protein